MTMVDVFFGLILLGVTCYLLFGGADFGAGLWHLVVARRRGGRTPADREVIEHAIGPVWEANHVWLIFVLVMGWTAFPPAFAAVAGSFWVPLSLAALGIVARGSAFAFRKAVPDSGAFAVTFAVSSVLTPYCLGAVAGGLLAGELGVWWSPTAVYAGLLTAGMCAYLAACYLTADARRLAGAGTAERFRGYALASGATVGALALAGPFVLLLDAPRQGMDLLQHAGWLLALSLLAGLASLALLVRRRYRAVRVSAALAVAAVVWGGAAAHYPHIAGPSVTVQGAAAGPTVLGYVLVALGIGAAITVPSLVWLYTLFQRAEQPARHDS